MRLSAVRLACFGLILSSFAPAALLGSNTFLRGHMVRAGIASS